MPKHIVRLILLLIVFCGGAYLAKRYFTVDSFYEYGHYRGSSVASIASDKPKFKGDASCLSCHPEQAKLWSTGFHYTPAEGKVVRCEVCHGPGGDRDTKGAFENVSTGNDHPTNLKLSVPADSVKLCTLCHEQITGRPAQQKQIVVAEHAGNQQCTACHNAHSLLTIQAAEAAPFGNAEAGKTKTEAEGCPACHGQGGVSNGLPGPNLAGQKETYLAAALKAYKVGTRGNSLMKDVAANVKDGDIDDIVAYFSASTCKSAQNGDAKAVAAGQALSARCVACHGVDGIGKRPEWPNLAGQSANYIVGALQAYKNGTRTNGFMTKIAQELTDTDAANLAAYFANAACQPKDAK